MFNTPNILSVFRILLIPVFVVYYSTGHIAVALMVLILSGLTDMIDGIIARNFDQVTPLGQWLDPVADKLTQAAVALSLAWNNWIIIPLVVIVFLKELLQAIGGFKLYKATKGPVSAKWYGKASTVAFYVVMGILLLLGDNLIVLQAILTAATCGFMLNAFVQYIRVYFAAKGDMGEQGEDKEDCGSPDQVRGRLGPQ